MAFGIHVKGIPTPGQTVFCFKSRITGRVAEFYPERGIVSIHSELPYTFGTPQPGSGEKFLRVSRNDFWARADALSRESRRLLDMANRDSGRARVYRQEANELMRLVDCMQVVIDYCDAQGDPIAMAAAESRMQARGRRSNLILPGHNFESPAPRPLALPASVPRADLGGTQVLSPSQIIVPAGR